VPEWGGKGDNGSGGPLSAEGLAELYHELLDLVKREVARE
jgi:hypothetical protein